MNHLTIARHVTELHHSLSSADLPISLIPAPAKMRRKPSEQLTSALVHEIRNPLSNIRLAVQMLKTLVSDDYQKTYLDIILRSSGRIDDIINDLLTSSRPLTMQPEKHSLHQLLDETLVLTKDRIMLKNITVSKEYSATDYKIVMNKPGMKIALTNIIINAIEAMPSAEGQLRLVTRSKNGRYMIQIEDNGCGISKKDMKTIFTPYFTRKPGGMGLGLSSTLDILLFNHVGVNVQSEPGKGTRFILLFQKKSV